MIGEEKNIHDDELNAAFYKVKHSNNEIEATEAAKYILNSHMDANGVRSILRTFSTSINEAKTSGDEDRATDIAQKSLNVMLAQLFTNSFRMGMLEQQNEYKKMVEDIQNGKIHEIIGDRAPENTEDENTSEG